jgi:L-rhamnose mutarotase
LPPWARLTLDPKYREWDALMRSMQERVPEAREGEWWAEMDEVFDLDWTTRGRR